MGIEECKKDEKNNSEIIVVGTCAVYAYDYSTHCDAGGGGEYNLTVTPGCGFNMLTWDAIPGAEHYFIYRAGHIQDYMEPLDYTKRVKDTQFKDTTSIENGKQYCYYVRGVVGDWNEIDGTIERCATPNCYEEDECKLVLKYQQDNVKYWVNDVEQPAMDTPPVNVNNRLFLVVRYVTQEISGTEISWDATTKTVIITRNDGVKIELQIGSKDAIIDGQTVQIDPNNPAVVPFIAMERTLLPMRFVAENLGATGPNDIKWFGDTKIVELRFDDPECDECEWIKGKIINFVYHAGTVTPYYEVEFEDCYKNLHLFHVEKNLADEKGETFISDAIGLCAELCVFDGIISKWNMSPELCCTNDENCEWIEGWIIYSELIHENKLRISFRKCDGTIIPNLYIKDFSEKSKNIKRDDYMAICVSREDHELIIKEWDIDNEKYCEGKKKKRHFGFVVDYVFCSEEEPSKVYGHGEGGYRWLLYVNDPDECKKLELDSFWLAQGRDTNEKVGNYRVVEDCDFEKLNEAYRDEVPTSVCLKIAKKEYSGDIPVLYGRNKVSNHKVNNQAFTLYPKNISDFENVEIGSCFFVQGNRISQPPINAYTLQLTSMEPADCPCLTPKYTEIIEKNCTDEQPYVIAKLLREDNVNREVRVTNEQCNNLRVGNCYMLSMKLVVGDDGEYWELILSNGVSCR
jgi:Copper amine oxidase N-terminal domain